MFVYIKLSAIMKQIPILINTFAAPLKLVEMIDTWTPTYNSYK